MVETIFINGAMDMLINKMLYAIGLFFFLIASAFAIPIAPFPAQLMVQVQQSPTPLVALGKNYLVYEIYLTSFYNSPATINSLEVMSADSTSSHVTFTKDSLAKLIHPIGAAFPDPNATVLQPGGSKIVFMWLEFDKASSIPNKLIHKIVVNAKHADETIVWELQTDPLTIQKIPPVIIGAPLQGNNWLAGSAPSNMSPHRGANILVNGNNYFAQRYAIDFIQLSSEGTSYHGDEFKNTSYFCYGKNALAVSPGKVIAIKDGLPENIPHSKKLASPLSLQTVAGNYVVVQIDANHFACYAHFIPGSIKVKVGDTVTKGQVIGRVGNSGNSTEPHLHFHITDKPSFIAANGVPYAFEHFTVRPIKIISEDPAKIEYLSDHAQPFDNQLVLENTLMNF